MVAQSTPLGSVPSRGLQAVYDGLESLGLKIDRLYSPPSNMRAVIICWGYKTHIAQAYNRKGGDSLVIELGYIGERTKNLSIGWNGLNNLAEFPNIPIDNGERFYSHGGKIEPWKKDGKYILILGQVKGDASLRGRDIMPWYIEQARKAREIYGLPVYYRPHPESVRRRGYNELEGVPEMKGTLQEAISGALFTISYNSNSSLDSIMAGVPSFIGDRGAMVYELGMKDIAKIEYPEREKVLYSLAWKQWTLEEIRAGLPFKYYLQMKGVV